MRALLIANAVDADAGFVGDRLRHHGFAFDECHREHPDEWPDLDGHDLVLLLGSEWSVYWPEVADEVAAEVALIREAQARPDSAALGAWCIEWLVEPRQSRHDNTADRQRRITDRGRRTRSGMRETHR
jgi:GMP synthase-like glutamine amidotransferase